MNLLKDDFLNTYQRISFKGTGESIKSADILRKCTALSYTASLSLCDNNSTCQLLETNLHKLSTVVNTENKNIYSSNLQSILKGTKIPQRHTSIHKLDVNSLIKNLHCSNTNDITCKQSENIKEDDFRNFLCLYNEKRRKSTTTEPKQRTFSKRFAPQTCNGKDRKFTKKSDVPIESCQSTVDIDDSHETSSKENVKFTFKTAREELNVQNVKKYGNSGLNTAGQKRKLGARRGLGSKFVSPMLSNNDSSEENSKSQEWVDDITDDRLKNLEPRMVELIKSEIMDNGPAVDWNDIAGLESAKTAIQEIVVWPMLRPDIFTGLRRPPKGILLFGPPGTGKTLIGKCVASQSKSTFFSISASSLTSKWVGDGEKMVRALFAVARCHQPAVIFIDEIDSLLSQRSDSEHESSRRIKTEFLVQLDGAATDSEERLLVIGATNRPQELDEAARRRFVKRLYIPLPELKARFELVRRLMSGERHDLKENDIMEIAQLSDGYSGADMRNLCSDASLGPIRSIDINLIHIIQSAEVRPVTMTDFRKALARVKSSVSPNDLDQYITWDKTYGSGSLI